MWIVELFPRHTQPVPQTVSAGVIKRDAGFMDFFARCLGDDQYLGLRIYLYDGPDAVRQMLRADRAVTDLEE